MTEEQEAAEQAAWDRAHAAKGIWERPRRRIGKRTPTAVPRSRKPREHERLPAPGEPGYSAYLAELSAELGSLEAAFDAAMGAR